MKKIIYTLVLVLTMATSVFASGENKARSGVVSNFKVQLKNTSELFWSDQKNISTAELWVNNKKTSVFYDTNGELIGKTTNISINDIARDAKEKVIQTLSGYTIKEAIFLTSATESAYLILANNDKETIVLKVDESNNVTTVRK